MKQWLTFPSVQFALCTACYAMLAYWTDKWTVLFLSPLYGAAVARPLINLLGEFRQTLRAGVWLPVHGQHYVFKDTTVHVLEDEDSGRWIKLADVELVLGAALNQRILSVTYPERLQLMGKPARMYMRDDALITYLGKQSDPQALRFRTWLERNVAFPGRRVRASAGIHPDDAP